MRASVQTFFLHIFPKAFDQVQVRRIGGQEAQIDLTALSALANQLTGLIFGVVQNHGELTGTLDLLRPKFSQQVAHRFCRDIAVVDHGRHPFREGVQSPQDIMPLPSRGGTYPLTGATPQFAHETSEDKMCRVHKEDSSFPVFAFLQEGMKRFFYEVFLIQSVFGRSFFLGHGMAPLCNGRNPRRWSMVRTTLGLRRIPVVF